MINQDKTIVDEQQLLNRLRDHDKEAFTMVYDAYAKKLFRYAVKIIKSAEIAEDTVHDIFVKLWFNAPTLQIQSSLQSYLYKLTQNHLLNLIKREAVQERFTDEMINTAAQFSVNTDDTVAYRETLAKTREAINCLPPKRKLIFEMGRNNGMSHRQIAQELNIAESTVNNQLVKALKFIKDHLMAHGAIGMFSAAVFLLKK